MLISHRKRFIYTKTVKTAGTSVESYFEKYCMPDGEWCESHARDESISVAGIIGYRGIDATGATWFNHMPSEKIRDQIGQGLWNSYFKFTVVRNPFDKLVSAFFMFENMKKKYTYTQRMKAFVRKIFDRGNPIDRLEGNTDVDRFRSWVKKGGKVIDRDKYLINGEVCVDYFIRYEELHEGIKYVCELLSIPFEPSGIPKFKKGERHHRILMQNYYDHETEKIVRELYAWEIERFGYDLPK